MVIDYFMMRCIAFIKGDCCMLKRVNFKSTFYDHF